LSGALVAHKFLVSGATIAVMDDDGLFTLMVSVPVVLPAGMLSWPQATPGTAVPQETATAPEKPVPGVTVIVEVPEDVPDPAVVVTEVAVPATVKLAVVPLPENVKLNTLFPPRAIGLGSAGPKELTMMKYVVPEVTLRFVICD